MTTGTSAGHRLLTVMGALLGAAALCLLTESAIARMVGPDILLPFQAGRFLPGRMAREGAALVLCLALALTEQGRTLRARLWAALEKDRYRWLLSAVVTGLFLAWTLRVTVTSFMTSDEAGILSSIRSVPTQGPAGAANTFSNVLFCWLIGSLYAIDPDFWWYTGYHLAAIALSLTVIGRCILLLLRQRPHGPAEGVVIHALLCGGVFMYTAVELSFTVTPAVVGSAAVALVLCREKTPCRAGRVCADAASVLLMLLCYLQRKSTGQCLLCFFALAVGYQCLRIALDSGHRRAGRLAAVVCVLLAVLCLANGSDRVANSGSIARNGSYSAAESSRSQIVDFLIDDLTDEDFQSAGIPPELGTLLRGWFFMDERINTDTFNKLADAYHARQSADAQTGEDLPDSVVSYGKTLLTSIREDPQMLWRSLVLASLVCLAVGAAWYGGWRRCWPELLGCLCALGGACILLGYLIVQGRFPTRVFLVVILPAITTVLLLTLTAAGESAPGQRRRAPLGMIYLSAAAAAICCLASMYHVPHILDAATPADLFGQERATEDYADAHPDILFITNIYDGDLDPYHDSHYPANRDLWGDGGDTSRTEGRLYADAFFRDDVQFMYEQPSTIIPLLQYLTLDYGPVQARAVAKLTQTVAVADLDQVSPGRDYTGWYEQNGMTYYFRHGQALTGEQTIDGTAYTFAPAGAQAQLVAAPGPEGVIYTTDAYSLVAPEADRP